MEYIEGKNLLSFIREKGTAWVPILILQLLSDLDNLHQQGWVFGDLKPENLIVTNTPVKIRCIDVGGTTKVGRAIKEYTEFLTVVTGDLAQGKPNLHTIYLLLQ